MPMPFARLVRAAKNNVIMQAYIVDCCTKMNSRLRTVKKWPKHCIITLEAWKQASENCQSAIDKT